jgi:hypothetical protein
MKINYQQRLKAIGFIGQFNVNDLKPFVDEFKQWLKEKHDIEVNVYSTSRMADVGGKFGYSIDFKTKKGSGSLNHYGYPCFNHAAKAMFNTVYSSNHLKQRIQNNLKKDLVVQ